MLCYKMGTYFIEIELWIDCKMLNLFSIQTNTLYRMDSSLRIMHGACNTTEQLK